MSDFLKAFFLIFVAEMGDKTQIMAMAFATKYKVNQILIGVALGSLLNHGIAIVFGTLLNKFIPIDALQLVAGIMFIAFGLLSLSITEEEEGGNGIKRYGAILTVAIAFFLGELGDKTQLTALTLSTASIYPHLTLAGTVVGMVVVSSVGIFVGAQLGDKIPEYAIKIVAFAIFMIFGINKTFSSSYVQSMGITFNFLVIIFVLILTIFRFIIFKRQISEISLSALRKKSSDLKAYRERILKNVEGLCKHCDVCKDKKCRVGYIKALLSNRIDSEAIDNDFIELLYEEKFDKFQAEYILKIIEEYYNKYPDEREKNLQIINIEKIIRKILY